MSSIQASGVVYCLYTVHVQDDFETIVVSQTPSCDLTLTPGWATVYARANLALTRLRWYS